MSTQNLNHSREVSTNSVVTLVYVIYIDPLKYPVGSTSHVIGTSIKPIVTKLTADRHVLESTGEFVIPPVGNMGGAPVYVCDQTSMTKSDIILSFQK